MLIYTHPKKGHSTNVLWNINNVTNDARQYIAYNLMHIILHTVCIIYQYAFTYKISIMHTSNNAYSFDNAKIRVVQAMICKNSRKNRQSGSRTIQTNILNQFKTTY